MRLDALRARWDARRASLLTLNAQVNAAELIAEFLDDLDTVAKATPPLTVREAAIVSGYSTGHIRRLLRTGAVLNAGTPRRPRVHAKDLPRKHGETLQEPVEVPKLRSTTHLARAVVASRGKKHG